MESLEDIMKREVNSKVAQYQPFLSSKTFVSVGNFQRAKHDDHHSNCVGVLEGMESLQAGWVELEVVPRRCVSI
jgi:hypothetical protein